MRMDRSTIVVIVAAFAVGYVVANSSSSPSPSPDRPALRWIVGMAKKLLWVALIAEPPPKDQPASRLVQADAVGADGYPLIDHGRGW
jgi:hypothetical protein